MKRSTILKIVISLLLVLIIIVSIIFIRICFDQKETVYKDTSSKCNKYYHTRVVNGDTYKIRNDVFNVLVIGIDRSEEEEKDFYQSDFLTVICFDKKDKTYNTIQINRDTMTSICYYSDVQGKHLKDEEAQIALSFSYGGTNNFNRAKNTVTAVENLLQMNINQFICFDIDSVKEIVDFADGVTVTIPYDMTVSDPSFIEGAEVLLDGEKAEKFIRERKHLEEENNALRMERHKIFYEAVIDSLKEKTFSDEQISDLYNSIYSRIYSSLNESGFLDLYDNLSTLYKYSGSKALDGEYNPNAIGYAEFFIDKTKMNNYILSHYYIKG